MFSVLKYASVLICLSSFSATIFAADRGHSIKTSVQSRSTTILSSDRSSRLTLPIVLAHKIRPGQVLDDSLYRQATVISHDDNTGLTSLDLNGSIIRILSTNREVVDVTG